MGCTWGAMRGVAHAVGAVAAARDLAEDQRDGARGQAAVRIALRSTRHSESLARPWHGMQFFGLLYIWKTLQHLAEERDPPVWP